MSDAERAATAVTLNEQTTCNEQAVTADDSLETGGGQARPFVVCLLEYSKKLVFLFDVIFRNKVTKIPHPTPQKIMEQAKQICKDYIYHKLTEKDMSEKLTFRGYNCTHSHHYIMTGQLLEKLYPRVYSDVSRKIGRTMSSAGIVKATLSDVLNILFKDSITWGKVVSMFAIASCFAEECVQQGHAHYVTAVVDTVGGFVDSHLSDWLARNGGWKGLGTALKDKNKTVNPSFVVGIIGAVIGVITVTTSLVIQMT